MAEVNEKIDEILKTVTSLDRRMKQFEDTFKAFESRVENNTTKIGEIQAEHIKLREMIYNNQDELKKMRQEKEEIL